MPNDTLLAEIRLRFGFGDDLRILKKVERGYLSENHIVGNAQEKFFLKQYRPLGRERIREIHAAKRFFFEGGIPVIFPVRNKSGETLFEWEGNFYSLFPFVQGKQYERLALTEKALRSCGKMLAEIHLQSKNGSPRIVQSRSFSWDRESFFQRAQALLGIIAGIKDKSDFDTRSESLILRKIELAKKGAPSWESFGLKEDHLIHGDFHEDNLFFNSDDEISAVFDWEKANTAPRAIELARAMEFLCFYGSYGEKNFQMAQAVLSEYNKMYTLSSDELERGIIAWQTNQLYSLWFLEEHYLKGNARVDTFLGSQVASLDYYGQNIEAHAQRLGSYVE